MPLEAKKVLVSEMGGTLLTIAKDVKIQVEFNPAKVKGYRLIGYENRALANRDFNDKKDAAVEAGHTVTVLYEIIPADSSALPGIDPLKYQQRTVTKAASNSAELMTVKLRYKQPTAVRVPHRAPRLRHGTRCPRPRTPRFSAAVASGMLLRNSQSRGAPLMRTWWGWRGARLEQTPMATAPGSPERPRSRPGRGQTGTEQLGRDLSRFRLRARLTTLR